MEKNFAIMLKTFTDVYFVSFNWADIDSTFKKEEACLFYGDEVEKKAEEMIKNNLAFLAEAGVGIAIKNIKTGEVKTIKEAFEIEKELAKTYGYTSEKDERRGGDFCSFKKDNIHIWQGSAHTWTKAILKDGYYLEHEFFPTIRKAFEGVLNV